jgi:hypothetical protein
MRDQVTKQQTNSVELTTLHQMLSVIVNSDLQHEESRFPFMCDYGGSGCRLIQISGCQILQGNVFGALDQLDILLQYRMYINRGNRGSSLLLSTTCNSPAKKYAGL